MKRIFATALLLTFVLMPLSAAHADINTRLHGESIAPYALTADETALLSAFGLAGNAHVLAFDAPAAANSLYLNVYSLEAGEWRVDAGGSIVGVEGEPLDGLFTMLIKPDGSMELRIVNKGTSSFTSAPLAHIDEHIASSVGFLQEQRSIELEEEIPVAMTVYDRDTAMSMFNLDDYHTPERFEGMDAVRFVTLMFSSDP